MDCVIYYHNGKIGHAPLILKIQRQIKGVFPTLGKIASGKPAISRILYKLWYVRSKVVH
jgi:hypothetical protein